MSNQGDLTEYFIDSRDLSEDLISNAGSDYNPEWEIEDTKKGRYQLITEQKRKRLINYIESKKVSVAKAAKRIGIKYSTAKTIYATYLKEGRTTTKFDKNSRKHPVKRKQSSREEANTPKNSRQNKKTLAKPKDKTSNATPNRIASATDQADQSSLICRIRILNPPAEYKEVVPNKRVKTEEITHRNYCEPNLPEKLEQETKRAGDYVQTQRRLVSTAKNPLYERQLLLSQLNHLLESNRPINYFQPPALNPLALNPLTACTYVTPIAPVRLTHPSLLNNLALQLNNARDQQQSAATMFFLNRIRK